MPEIGDTLREARMRARIDVSEIEAQTKIRAKYLRALENEEWDLLPGPTYVRSFLRTYADALGVDPRPLLEAHRRTQDRPSDVELAPIAPRGRGRGQRQPQRPRVSPAYAIGVGVLLVVIVLAAIGLLSGGGSGHSPRTAVRPAPVHRARHRAPATRAASTHRRVSLQLQPTGPVYVCLLGSGGRKLIDKATLQPGTPQPTFHSTRFTIALGNSSLTMKVNGRTLAVPPSNNPTGYVITAQGRHTLPLGRLPTCA